MSIINYYDVPTPHRFSFFRAPVRNTTPYKSVSVRQIYNVVTGDYYRETTLHLRNLCRLMKEGKATKRDVQRFKSEHFDYATFSGVFSCRRNDALLQHSGLLCLDFDHLAQWRESPSVGGVYGLRYLLMNDTAVDSRLILRSPGGEGLKWVVAIDPSQATHGEWFDALSFYVERNYGVQADPSGRDVSRACYLPWDPDAVIFE
ncbi:MAG: hypothetical protein IJ511_00600 [Bacteroides sp.]|nr:hypothetical protein [Bacteroides sp.]